MAQMLLSEASEKHGEKKRDVRRHMISVASGHISVALCVCVYHRSMVVNTKNGIRADLSTEV